MLIGLLIWIYSAALIAIFQWPDILSMIITFVLLGALPLILLIVLVARGKRINEIRRQQRVRRDADKAMSVHGRVSNVDNQDPDAN